MDLALMDLALMDLALMDLAVQATVGGCVCVCV